MLLTKGQIVAADDLRREIVDVPEWGGEVQLISLTFAAAVGLIKKDGDIDPRLRLIAACLVDEDGNQVFTEEELAELSQKSAPVITRLWQRAVALNELTLRAADAGEKDPGDA